MTSRVEYFQGGWMRSDAPEVELVVCPDCGEKQYVNILAKMVTCVNCRGEDKEETEKAVSN